MKKIIAAYQRLRLWLAFERIVDFYTSAGSPNPRGDAWAELGMRTVLEDLRDYASAHWNEYASLSDVIDAWREAELKPRLKHMPYQHAKLLSKLVKDIRPSELLHQEEYQKWLNRRESPELPSLWNDMQARVLLTGG